MIFYIEKLSQTLTDSFAVFGAAYLINAIADGRSSIIIKDAGPAYTLTCEPEWQNEWVEQATFFSAAPFLVTIDNKTGQKVIKGADVFLRDLPISPEVVVDYESEKHKNADFFAWRKGLSKEELTLLRNGQLSSPSSPHPDWDLFRAINPAALQAYNGLVGEWYRGRGAFGDMLHILLNMLSQFPNDITGAEEAWEALCKAQNWPVTLRVTASQLFNPAQGKGTNAAKSVWSNPGNLNSFWMLEYLKTIGIRYGGFTRLVKGAKDRKTYALIPTHLAWDVHDRVMSKFRQKMAGSAGAIQMDVLAALRYTKALLEHCSEAQGETLAAFLLGQSPNHVVNGMHTAFYKDMGNAIATMNIATLGLPQWVRPRNPKDFIDFKNAITEHETILRSLDESHSDAYELLKHYRDFLSANDLNPFFRFTALYSVYVMHCLDQKQFVRPFTTSTLEILFMNSENNQPKYRLIVQDMGFQNIAYAIRHSTVIPQGYKARGNRPVVDIRYGLGQQLCRSAAYPQDFLAEITEFIHLYNAENAQLREKGRKLFRKNVTTDDLDCLVNLVDRFGSKVICNMLVAYGYAREPYDKTEEVGELAENDHLNENEVDAERESED